MRHEAFKRSTRLGAITQHKSILHTTNDRSTIDEHRGDRRIPVDGPVISPPSIQFQYGVVCFKVTCVSTVLYIPTFKFTGHKDESWKLRTTFVPWKSDEVGYWIPYLEANLRVYNQLWAQRWLSDFGPWQICCLMLLGSGVFRLRCLTYSPTFDWTHRNSDFTGRLILVGTRYRTRMDPTTAPCILPILEILTPIRIFQDYCCLNSQTFLIPCQRVSKPPGGPDAIHGSQEINVEILSARAGTRTKRFPIPTWTCEISWHLL